MSRRTTQRALKAGYLAVLFTVLALLVSAIGAGR